MSRFKDFVDFAIRKEIEAALLYEKYSKIVSAPAQQNMLKDLASTEREHERKLRQLDRGNGLGMMKAIPDDMQLTDFQVAAPLTENSSIQEVMLFAIKAEQKAFELYDRLSRLEETPECINLFSALANEEKKHKFELESQYEKFIMQEN